MYVTLAKYYLNPVLLRNPCDRFSLSLILLSSALSCQSRFGILGPHLLGITLVGLLDTLDISMGRGGVLVLFLHD